MFYNKYGEPRFGLIATFVIVGALVLGLLGWGLSVALAPIFGAGNAYKKTEGANYRIQNYDKFKDDCNAITSTEAKITLAEQTLDRDVKAGVDSGTIDRDRQNLGALMNIRVEQIAAYNSDASKNKTRAKFKDAGLPDHIDINQENGAVSCPSE